MTITVIVLLSLAIGYACGFVCGRLPRDVDIPVARATWRQRRGWAKQRRAAGWR